MQWDTMTLKSAFSRKGIKSSLSRISGSSEEQLTLGLGKDLYELPAMPSIQVTREVEVTYERTNAPYVHAALVGLIQGEIMNPKLVKR
jgi:hypothetical protein